MRWTPDKVDKWQVSKIFMDLIIAFKVDTCIDTITEIAKKYLQATRGKNWSSFPVDLQNPSKVDKWQKFQSIVHLMTFTMIWCTGHHLSGTWDKVHLQELSVRVLSLCRKAVFCSQFGPYRWDLAPCLVPDKIRITVESTAMNGWRISQDFRNKLSSSNDFH